MTPVELHRRVSDVRLFSTCPIPVTVSYPPPVRPFTVELAGRFYVIPVDAQGGASTLTLCVAGAGRQRRRVAYRAMGAEWRYAEEVSA